MEGKIKVIWICHFSNSDVRKLIQIDKAYYRKILCLLKRRPCSFWNDFAVWNTNAIKQFEKYSDIDLTVVFPYPGVKGLVQRFDNNGIHYVAFRSENDNFLSFVKDKLFENNIKTFRKNRDLISSIIKEVNPDMVHVIGAENPYYSIAALDIPDSIPSIVSTQTLMSLPNFLKNYPISKSSYEYRSKLEQQILKKCSYVASRVERTQKYIRENINPNAIFLQMPLALGVDVDVSYEEKKYDFVYFAANINKACDYAIEAFALANKQHSGLTLNVSGSYQAAFKARLEARLQELGILEQVHFSGPKASHDDVLSQIKKSRFAILPLKVDLISGTIREAMACGLPVVTTITPATPKLNEERESVLLSEKGDYQAMADNMIRLVENETFASLIRNNAIKTVQEKYSNESFMLKWRKAYYQIIKNFHNGEPFTNDVLSL